MKSKLFFVTLILILVIGFSPKSVVAQDLRLDLGLTAPLGYLVFYPFVAGLVPPYIGLLDVSLTSFYFDNNSTNKEKYFNIGGGMRLVSLWGLFNIMYPQAVLEWTTDNTIISLNAGGGLFIAFSLLPFFNNSGIFVNFLPGAIIDFNVDFVITSFFKVGGGVVTLISSPLTTYYFLFPFVLKGTATFYF